jgi:hypothetical protein
MPIPIYLGTLVKLVHGARHQASLEDSIGRQPWHHGSPDQETMNGWVKRWRAKRQVVCAEDRLTTLSIRWRLDRLPVAHNMEKWRGGLHPQTCTACGEAETQLHLLACPGRVTSVESHIEAHVAEWWGRKGDGPRALDAVHPFLRLDTQQGLHTVSSLIARYRSSGVRTGMETVGQDEGVVDRFLYFLRDSLVDLFRTQVWLPRCGALGARTRWSWTRRARQPTGRRRGRPRGMTGLGTLDEKESRLTELGRATNGGSSVVLGGEPSRGLWSMAA